MTYRMCIYAKNKTKLKKMEGAYRFGWKNDREILKQLA